MARTNVIIDHFKSRLTFSVHILLMSALLTGYASLPARGAANIQTDAPPNIGRNAVANKMCSKLQEAVSAAQQGGAGLVLRVKGRVLDCSLSAGPLQMSESVNISDEAMIRVASIGKVYTALIIHRLAEQGKLNLNASIAEYLDNKTVDRLHIIDGVSRGKEITILQLLDHSSGLENYPRTAGFREEFWTNPRQQWTRQRLLEYAIEAGAIARPGETYYYSDTGYILLAEIAELVTGKSLAVLNKEYVSEPAGLQVAILEGFDAIPDRALATAYHQQFSTNMLGENTFDSYGGGGIITTADDLVRLIMAVFVDGLVRPDTLALMMRVDQQFADGQTRQGYGLRGSNFAGEECWGHTGFWGAFMYYCPNRQLAVAGSFNQTGRKERRNELMRFILSLDKPDSSE